MNTLMLELIFPQRCDILFSDQNSYSFVVRVLEIIAPLTGTPYWALISVICWQSFFLVFVKSNVASVTLSATVPDMPNGRYFILSWTWMLNKTVWRNLEVQVLHWVVERLQFLAIQVNMYVLGNLIYHQTVSTQWWNVCLQWIIAICVHKTEALSDLWQFSAFYSFKIMFAILSII